MWMPILPSGVGTGFGSIRPFATGTSRRCCPRSAVPSWRSRARMTNTGPWSRSWALPARFPTRRCCPWRPAAIHRTVINPRRFSPPPPNSSPVSHRRAASVRHMPVANKPRRPTAARAPAGRTLAGRTKNRRADPQDAAYLRMLADKIRDARAQRGMTRNALAADSGVSLRFLAQLESGQGNPSILVLRHIASAIGFPTDNLLSDEPPPAVDRVLLMQMLKQLPDDDVAKARRLLTQHFGRVALSDAKKPYITLIGLRGAGKTTLGRRLAKQRGVPFFELDREVERQYGATIGEILQLHGQPGYRRFERETLQSVLTHNAAAIIETGGGLAADPETLPLLLEYSIAVWVRASPEEHMQRVIDQGDLRPMARSREAMRELKEILKAREPFYRQAHLHLTTSGRTADQSFEELLRLLARG